MLKPGDKCPNCREGLLVRTDVGLACDECSYNLSIEEVERAVKEMRQKPDHRFVWRARTFKITIEDPEEGEEFLRGLILARQNNNSEYFVDLIDTVNAVLEPWRAARLAEEMRARDRVA